MENFEGASFTYDGGVTTSVGLPGNVEVENFEGVFTQVPCTCSGIHTSVGQIVDISTTRVEGSQVLSTQAAKICNDRTSRDVMDEGNCSKVGDYQIVYTRDDVRDVIEEGNKVECSKIEAVSSLVDPKNLVGKVDAILADALNPVVSHLCNEHYAKVEFERKTYEVVDDPSDRSECPEAFIPSNIFRHMKKKHHLGKYAKLLDYPEKTEFRRDIDKMLRHNRNCKKTAPVTLERVHTLLDSAITFLEGNEAGLLRKNESELARKMGENIDKLKKMKSGVVHLLLASEL